MTTGENEQGLRKIIDMTRLSSIVILVISFYYYGYEAMTLWGYTTEFVDRIFVNIQRTGLFNSIWTSKLFALGLLVVSLIGATGKKDEKISLKNTIGLLVTGLIIYLLSHLIFYARLTAQMVIILYALLTALGYVLVLTGGTWLSRLIQLQLRTDIFNKLNESFPQEERLLENEYSINLRAQYVLNGKVRQSWVNVINPFRGVLVAGTPGAGKTYFVIRTSIIQHIQKGFCMFIYDFKYPDLSLIAYNALLKYRDRYKKTPKFYVIDFDNIMHRCNPLDPASMNDITDASESSRTIMMGLNREWIKRQGDFFVESPINFVTAIIWFLRKYKDGIYCTLPHVIELMQIEYRVLFPLLRTEKEIEVLINPFESAYRHEAWEQLEGQIASAKISMARLVSPMLYYVLSKSEFTLDINNPDDPKIVCLGNNPQKQQIYGAVLSLYIARMLKLVNQKGKLKSSLFFDEFPTIYTSNIDTLLATARSNKVATTLAVQDHSQLRKDYGREQADVIMNITGNVISGQVVAETAKTLSDRFGKIVQERESVSINRTDTSISRSTQLDSAIPPSKIASLSSGEFVGMVADNPDQKIDLKVFHCEVLNDHDAIHQEEQQYKPIPPVRKIEHFEIQENYERIKQDIQFIIEDVLPTDEEEAA